MSHVPAPAATTDIAVRTGPDESWLIWIDLEMSGLNP
ncbi:MAG: hypothetical protein RIS35_1315, partial [Pseudomonadota bacterium]